MVYNLKPIIDYINGNDVEGHSIDELENDSNFMKRVIIFSNDKNFYRLCSEDLKRNYEFVNFLISKFSYDHKYIDEVVSYYLKNNDNEEEKVSIIIKMCNICEESRDTSLFAKYRLLFLAKFITDMLSIDAYKANNPDDHEIGLGFILFIDQFNFDEEALKYYAKNMISHIFDELNVNLEDEIHHKYRNANDINNDGIMNFMINFLRKYDVSLADYASVHTDILNEFQERINKIQVKWNKYIDSGEKQKYLLMYDRVHEYMQDHEFETFIGEDTFIYYIGRELRISDKLATYSGLDRATYEQLNSDIDYEFIRITLSDFKERMFYTNIKRIMLETIFGEYEEKNSEGVVIDFNCVKGRK